MSNPFDSAFFKIFVNVSWLATAILNTSSSYADMAQIIIYNEDLESIISYYKKNSSVQKDQIEVLQWAQFAKDVFGMNTLSMDTKKSADQVTKEDIIKGIATQITTLEWTPIADTKVKQKLKDGQENLKIGFGPKSFSWAWVEFQLGRPGQSKQILQTLFEAEYKSVLALEEIGFGFRYDYNNIKKPLLLLSTKEEQIEIQKKLKRIETHISNLPDSTILT